MLSLLEPKGVCPCCAYAMTPPAMRSSALSGRAAAALDERLKNHRADSRPSLTLALRGGSIIDPVDGGVIENATVLMNQGRITAVEPDGWAESDPSVQSIDARGKFIVPGYNDMHSHVLELEDPSGALALMLAEGVTGFRQMSGSPERLAQRRSGTLPIGPAAPAVLEMPGTILTPLNGATADAVTTEIRLQRDQGADFIKVGMLGGPEFAIALAEARRQGIPILGHLQEGVDAVAAVKSGFRSVEHLGPGITVWLACSSAEEELKRETKLQRFRAPPMNVPFLRRLIMWRLQTMLINPAAFTKPTYTTRLQRALDTFDLDKCDSLAVRFIAEDTWHCPTLVRLRTQQLADEPDYDRDPYLRYMPRKSVKSWRAVTERFKKLPEAMRRTYRQTYSKQLELTKAFADRGVRLLAGTDGGWLAGPGLTLKEEFAELGKAGLSPLKILQMATINAAEYLGREETMGTVKVGRDADLVVLDANPLDSVANLHRISGVVRDGKYFSRGDLDGLRDRVGATRGSLH